ncbi:putative DNA-binding protein [Jeotgalicoccus aerolatus]|uniref:UPF0122 protein J2Z27_000486 n=1 Tax=Jeotgalicoccus aerolatus TaxID=709510 RepID=A0A1G8W9A4_9STAP|nr:putative DNA-binding protein [Jeotgalicoccus aerolatus]MBP1951460.1 putative DNA-binding protein YlxM (UPF0122 family) [Jeotgalicoccus aerolatus]NMA81821.1 putative DNA-binding protein [Jeotgalicoccus aerolatus]CAD2076531.1 putative DNA-binding protein [Jeotgalicoccus aerolatus]SDJ74844.1 hypothetical protein SAMN05216187_102168 [Jeotgalicoccus aerolatus]GGD97316.1 UPF0122 protein [Jeotgalicoccus aerolatus]
MTTDLERTMRMNYLYDFYQSLLTEKQQKYIELYYLEDFQFSEIAEEMNVTRQAVYDNLKRSRDMLEQYEETLGMYKNFNKRLDLYAKLKKQLGGNITEDVKQIIDKLEKLD